MRVLNPNCPSMFDQGRLPFGAYSGELRSNGERLTFGQRRFHRKSWLFVGHFSETVYAGFAIADAGYAANAFAYVFLPATNTFVERSVIRPFGFSGSHNPEIGSGWNLGPFKIEAEAHLYRAHVDVPGLSMQMELRRKGDRGVSFICPSTRGHVFTFKNVGLESQVVYDLGGQTGSDRGNCGALDFSNGFPPRETTWKWACAVGTTKSGKSVALNLVSDHNGGIENVAWLDDAPALLPTDATGGDLGIELSNCDCSFAELGARSEKIGLGLVSHDFKQSFGPCEGTIFGEPFNGVGVFENHYSKW